MVDQHSLKLALPLPAGAKALPLQHLPLFAGVLNAFAMTMIPEQKRKKNAMAGAGLL